MINGYPELPLNSIITATPTVSGDNFSTDWVNSDGIVASATFTPATAAGYGTPVTLDYIVTTPVRVEEPQDTWGKYRRWVTTVYFPTQYMTTAPKPRDLICWGFMLGSQGPISFSICKITDTPYLGSPWACTADFMDFQPVLEDTITIQTPVVTTDNWGSNISTMTNLFTDLPCAIEPITEEKIDFQGVRGWEKKYRIYVNKDTDLPWGTIIIDQNSVKYTMTSFQNKQRLDELTVIEAVIMPDTQG